MISASEATQNRRGGKPRRGRSPHSHDYYAFGKVYGTPTENVTHPCRFTGRAWDPETSLYYYRARYYAPTLGQFSSRDRAVKAVGAMQADSLASAGRGEPSHSVVVVWVLFSVAEEAPGATPLSRRALQIPMNTMRVMELYAYCRSSPPNLLDPTGHDWKQKVLNKATLNLRPVKVVMIRYGYKWDPNYHQGIKDCSKVPVNELRIYKWGVLVFKGSHSYIMLDSRQFHSYPQFPGK